MERRKGKKEENGTEREERKVFKPKKKKAEERDRWMNFFFSPEPEQASGGSARFLKASGKLLCIPTIRFSPPAPVRHPNFGTVS